MIIDPKFLSNSQLTLLEYVYTTPNHVVESTTSQRVVPCRTFVCDMWYSTVTSCTTWYGTVPYLAAVPYRTAFYRRYRAVPSRTAPRPIIPSHTIPSHPIPSLHHTHRTTSHPIPPHPEPCHHNTTPHHPNSIPSHPLPSHRPPSHRTPFYPITTGGDETVRTRVYDLLAAARPSNPIAWPAPYDSSGVAANAFTKKWNTHEKDLAAHLSRRWVGLCFFRVLCLSLLMFR